MDFLRKHRKICSAVAALMVAVLVVYSYGSFRSYAAAPEVSTLPADNIGAEVNYDADSITLKYNGNTYVFNRHMSFDELISDLESVDELDNSLLYKVQHVNGSNYLYWLSHSYNCVYILYDDVYGNGSSIMVSSTVREAYFQVIQRS